MILNIIVGFIIPWIIALFLVQERKILCYIAPFASTISFIIDDFGFYFFWNLYPFQFNYLSAIPFNLGLFSLYPCLMIQLMRKYKVNGFIALPLAALLLTILESCGLLFGRVKYFNNWNLIGTYFSYFVACSLSYSFYELLKIRYFT